MFNFSFFKTSGVFLLLSLFGMMVQAGVTFTDSVGSSVGKTCVVNVIGNQKVKTVDGKAQIYFAFDILQNCGQAGGSKDEKVGEAFYDSANLSDVQLQVINKINKDYGYVLVSETANGNLRSRMIFQLP